MAMQKAGPAMHDDEVEVCPFLLLEAVCRVGVLGAVFWFHTPPELLLLAHFLSLASRWGRQGQDLDSGRLQDQTGEADEIEVVIKQGEEAGAVAHFLAALAHLSVAALVGVLFGACESEVPPRVLLVAHSLFLLGGSVRRWKRSMKTTESSRPDSPKGKGVHTVTAKHDQVVLKTKPRNTAGSAGTVASLPPATATTKHRSSRRRKR